MDNFENMKEMDDINFSIKCAKIGLNNLMKQVELGLNDPDLFDNISYYQKEIIKMEELKYGIV